MKRYDSLKDAGIDPGEGMKYCLNDPVLYQSLLKEYEYGYDEKTQMIRDYYDASDWKNYSIPVHAFISSSKSIGAGSLSVLAGALEAAADRKDVSRIRSLHERMMEEYRRTVTAILTLMERDGVCISGQDASPSEEDETIEFLQEDLS